MNVSLRLRPAVTAGALAAAMAFVPLAAQQQEKVDLDAIYKIKEEGFDIFLVLEATIGFNRRDEESSPELVSSRRKKADPEFSINAHDVRFLKSLRISVDDAA